MLLDHWIKTFSLCCGNTGATVMFCTSQQSTTQILPCISRVHSQHLVRITHLNYLMSNKSLFQICFSQVLNQHLASKSNSFHCAACEKLCCNINNFYANLDHLLSVVMLYKWTVNLLSIFLVFFNSVEAAKTK